MVKIRFAHQITGKYTVDFPITAAMINNGNGSLLRTIPIAMISGIAESIATMVSKNNIRLLFLVSR